MEDITIRMKKLL